MCSRPSIECQTYNRIDLIYESKSHAFSGSPAKPSSRVAKYFFSFLIGMAAFGSGILLDVALGVENAAFCIPRSSPQLWPGSSP